MQSKILGDALFDYKLYFLKKYLVSILKLNVHFRKKSLKSAFLESS